MCVPALLPILGGVGAVIGNISASTKAANATRDATAANERTAAADAQRSTEQFNRANQKVPDIAAMMSSNQQAMKQGIGATFLTGAQGIKSTSLSLSKPALLGA